MAQRPVLGSFLLAIGGAFLTVYRQRQDLVSHFPTRELATYFPLIKRVGPVFLILGFLLIMCGLIFIFYGGLQSLWLLLKRLFLPSGWSRFECIPAESEDIEGLWIFYSHFFGKDAPALAAMQEWHQRNPDAFWILFKISRPRPMRITRELVGSFKIFPVNQACVSLLDREAVSGTTIPVEMIVTTKSAAALYVGDVAATNKDARAALVAYLDREVSRANKSGLPIYARPLSKEGLHLLTVHGFRPVSASLSDKPFGHIFKLLPRQAKVKSAKRGERILHKFRDPI